MSGPAAVAAAPTAAASAAVGPDGTIRFRERWKSAGYTALPNVVLRSRRLNNTAKVLYGLLLSYAWEKDHAWPGQEALAAHLDATARTVRNALADLKAAGLITVEQRGLRQTNVYWIESLEAFATAEEGEGGGPAPPFRSERQKTAAPERQPLARQERQATAAKSTDSAQEHPNEQPPVRRVVAASSRTEPPPAGSESDDVVALLLAQGVTARVAQSLLAQHSADSIRQQLQWQQARPKATNPAGALVQAIRQQWAPPQAWLEARARETATARQAEAAAARDAEETARRRRQEAMTPEAQVAGPLLLWVTRQRLHGREPTPTELDTRRCELLAQLHGSPPS